MSRSKFVTISAFMGRWLEVLSSAVSSSVVNAINGTVGVTHAWFANIILAKFVLAVEWFTEIVFLTFMFAVFLWTFASPFEAATVVGGILLLVPAAVINSTSDLSLKKGDSWASVLTFTCVGLATFVVVKISTFIEFVEAAAVSWSWIAGWEFLGTVVGRVISKGWIPVFTSLWSTFPDRTASSGIFLNLDLASFISGTSVASFSLESAFSPLVFTRFLARF